MKKLVLLSCLALSCIFSSCGNKEEEPVNQNQLDIRRDYANYENDFIIPDSSVRRLTEDDLDYLTPEELEYAKYEIYARAGYFFPETDLFSYFSEFEWYNPTTLSLYFDPEIDLNVIEFDNVNLIDEYLGEAY